MLSVYQILFLLLAFITSCFGSPFDRRHTNVSLLISCTPASLQIDQFTTFSGNADTPPHITFFVMNPSPGAPGRMLCTATLGFGEGNFISSSFYSCEEPGTGFNWQSGQLKVFQYQVCINGMVNSPSRQIVIAAQGGITTTSYPGEYGGEYTESITGSDSIPILRVEDARSLNRGVGRAVEENVMCGNVGSSNVVYSIGPCNLTAFVPGVEL